MVSIFPICKSRDHKENFLKFSLQYIQLFRRNCRDTKFWLCLTDHAWSKSFLFAYLGTLKNISWSFQLNVSSRLGGIVQTKFWLCLIDIGCSKVLSDFQKFSAQSIQHYGGVVWTKFWLCLADRTDSGWSKFLSDTDQCFQAAV